MSLAQELNSNKIATSTTTTNTTLHGNTNGHPTPRHHQAAFPNNKKTMVALLPPHCLMQLPPNSALSVGVAPSTGMIPTTIPPHPLAIPPTLPLTVVSNPLPPPASSTHPVCSVSNSHHPHTNNAIVAAVQVRHGSSSSTSATPSGPSSALVPFVTPSPSSSSLSTAHTSVALSTSTATATPPMAPHSHPPLADSCLDTLFIAPSSTSKVESALAQYKISAVAVWKPAGRRCTFVKFCSPGRTTDALLLLRQHFHAVQYAKKNAMVVTSNGVTGATGRVEPSGGQTGPLSLYSPNISIDELVLRLGTVSLEVLEEALSRRERAVGAGGGNDEGGGEGKEGKETISAALQILLIRLCCLWRQGAWVPTPAPGAPAPDEFKQPYYDPRYSNSLLSVFGLSGKSAPGDFVPVRTPTPDEIRLFQRFGDFHIDEEIPNRPRIYRFRMWDGLMVDIHPSHTTRYDMAMAFVSMDPESIHLEAFDEDGTGRLLYETGPRAIEGRFQILMLVREGPSVDQPPTSDETRAVSYRYDIHFVGQRSNGVWMQKHGTGMPTFVPSAPIDPQHPSAITDSNSNSSSNAITTTTTTTTTPSATTTTDKPLQPMLQQNVAVPIELACFERINFDQGGLSTALPADPSAASSSLYTYRPIALFSVQGNTVPPYLKAAADGLVSDHVP